MDIFTKKAIMKNSFSIACNPNNKSYSRQKIHSGNLFTLLLTIQAYGQTFYSDLYGFKLGQYQGDSKI